MSETTPRFDLPLIAAGQAQKHVPVNEALGKLDALIHLSVLGRSSGAPEEPEPGDRHIVGPGAGGPWTGQDGKIASFDSGWQFLTPRAGWLCWDAGTEELLVFTDGTWQAFSGGGGGGGATFQNIPLLGVGAEADEINPFTAQLNSALWTARETDDGGTGDLRYVMNKQTGANVLSLLFQSGFGGRAEIGLIGDEDFLFKVSADGTVWREALRIDSTTGRAVFPQGGVREMLAADRVYYVRPDGSDANDGLADSAAGAFQTLQKALDVCARIDFGGHTVTIQLADGTYAAGGVVPVTVGQKLASSLLIRGNEANPQNVVVNATGRALDVVNGARCRVLDMELRASVHCLSAMTGGICEFGNVRFGPAGQNHIISSQGAAVLSVGNYSIVGGAARHILCDRGASVENANKTITLSGAPHFSTAFAEASLGGTMRLYANTYSGPATGVRYNANLNGTIQTFGAGATALPGDAPGATATGGQYA